MKILRALLVVLTLSGGMLGCKDYVRAVAHLYGYEGDPYANPCAPESLSVGHCVPPKPAPPQQEEVKP